LSGGFLVAVVVVVASVIVLVFALIVLVSAILVLDFFLTFIVAIVAITLPSSLGPNNHQRLGHTPAFRLQINHAGSDGGQLLQAAVKGNGLLDDYQGDDRRAARLLRAGKIEVPQSI
jgi:hypothetical protein